MQFIKGIFGSFFSMDTYGDTDLGHEHFPNTIEGFGYHFNENGQLRKIETGKWQLNYWCGCGCEGELCSFM
jgi:hypothetical protein